MQCYHITLESQETGWIDSCVYTLCTECTHVLEIHPASSPSTLFISNKSGNENIINSIIIIIIVFIIKFILILFQSSVYQPIPRDFAASVPMDGHVRDCHYALVGRKSKFSAKGKPRHLPFEECPKIRITALCHSF